MTNVYEVLKENGLDLPAAPAKGGLYTPCVPFAGNNIYVSGCGCIIGDAAAAGKIGKDYTLEEGQEFAKRAMLNVLAALEAAVGDLNKVKRAIKILVFVASDDEFYQQPQVANGASAVLAVAFGQENVPARSAIGVNVLPGNLPIEIEAIFEVEE